MLSTIFVSCVRFLKRENYSTAVAKRPKAEQSGKVGDLWSFLEFVRNTSWERKIPHLARWKLKFRSKAFCTVRSPFNSAFNSNMKNKLLIVGFTLERESAHISWLNAEFSLKPGRRRDV